MNVRFISPDARQRAKPILDAFAWNQEQNRLQLLVPFSLQGRGTAEATRGAAQVARLLRRRMGICDGARRTK